jgi:hypothetical protein
MNALDYVRQFAELDAILQGADHVDVKTQESRVSLREFVAGLLSYQPAWVMALFAVRWAFVRLLGMKQSGTRGRRRYRPEDVSMTPGDRAAFFTVEAAREDQYWVAEASDTHLIGRIAVVVEPLIGDHKRFHVVTIVHYRRWTGPVYFNVIRPFHHLVVYKMAKSAASYSTA